MVMEYSVNCKRLIEKLIENIRKNNVDISNMKQNKNFCRRKL